MLHREFDLEIDKVALKLIFLIVKNDKLFSFKLVVDLYKLQAYYLTSLKRFNLVECIRYHQLSSRYHQVFFKAYLKLAYLLYMKLNLFKLTFF